MAKRKIIIVFFVYLSTAVFTAQTQSLANRSNRTGNTTAVGAFQDGTKTVSDVTVHWNALTYRKMLYNPSVRPQYRDSRGTESLSLSCEILMADPRLLLGIIPDPVIEKIEDSRGNEVEFSQKPPASGRRYVQDVFFIRWMREINLNHPERTRMPAEHNPPNMELGAGLRERLGGKIGLLKGYYEALMAESIEYIDLPFRPDENWVRLTEDVEIRVAQARNVPDVYHYDIEQRPAIAPAANRISTADPLPGRLVVGRQMIGRNDSMISAGSGGGPGSIGGKGDGIGRAEGIRYVIAVNPAPVRIPFELRQIPVSVPAGTAPPRIPNPDRLKPKLGGRFIPHQARIAAKYEADKMRSRNEPIPLAEEGRLFEVNWHSVSYTLNIYNPAVSRMKNSSRLLVRCDAKILDPERVIGTCDEPVIELIRDGGGRNIDMSLAQPRPDRMCYKSPGYRLNPALIPPSPLVQLEGKMRSALGMPLQRRHLPSHKSELEPVNLSIRIDPGILGQNQKELGCIKGFFHILTAESYKHTKVPFKPSREWIRLTSDLEIQVARAWHDGFKYRFEINERSKAKIEPGRLNVYCPLPDGILLERRLTGPDMPPKRDDIPRPERSLPVQAGGNGLFGHSVKGVECKVDTIDYLIATGPAHYRIPFEFEHIPLPEP